MTINNSKHSFCSDYCRFGHLLSIRSSISRINKVECNHKNRLILIDHRTIVRPGLNAIHPQAATTIYIFFLHSVVHQILHTNMININSEMMRQTKTAHLELKMDNFQTIAYQCRNNTNTDDYKSIE